MRTSFFILSFVFALNFYAFDALGKDDPVAWSSIDRMGLFNTEKDGRLYDDLWEDYSQEYSVQLLNLYPQSLKSGAHRSLIRSLLLSGGPKQREDLQSPTFLVKRLELLIRYGLFDDAEKLYKSVIEAENVEPDASLAMIPIYLRILSNGLPEACLDIQAGSDKFKDDRKWAELTHFCSLKYVGNGGSNNTATDFKEFPVLARLLNSGDQEITVSSSFSLGETVIALADNRITDATYQKTASSIEDASDLFIAVALEDKRLQKETIYQCYAIESVVRGIRNKEFLAGIYDAQSFPEDMLNQSGGQINIHPCAIPSLFYKRLQQTQTDGAIANELTFLMAATQSMPLHALLPFTPYLEKHAPEGQEWRSAMVLGLDGAAIPDVYGQSVAPLKALQNTNQMDERAFFEWKKAYIDTQKLSLPDQPITPLLVFLKINNSDYNKLTDKSLDINYENFFSLTYAGKSLHSAVGKYELMSKALRDKDIAKLISYGLIPIGNAYPYELHKEEIFAVASMLKTLKKDGEMRTLMFESLQ